MDINAMQLNKKKKRKKKKQDKKKKKTGCPKQEKTIPPIAAETMTTTKSEINLRECKT